MEAEVILFVKVELFNCISKYEAGIGDPMTCLLLPRDTPSTIEFYPFQHLANSKIHIYSLLDQNILTPKRVTTQ